MITPIKIAVIPSNPAAGVIGVIAVIRNHERSWMVWSAILPGTMVLVFLLGEFLLPH